MEGSNSATESVPRSIAIIRCTEVDPIVEHLTSTLSKALPSVQIIYVVDAIDRPAVKSDDALTIAMTASELDHLGLYHGDPRTGWICGDYAYYLALQLDWRYAWLIEPDVYINERATAQLREADQSNADLLTTDFHKAESGWSWKPRLETVTDSIDTDTYACFFPLTRASRQLVSDCLLYRQSMTSTLRRRPELWTPNDESVVATVAASKYRVIDLLTTYPRTFRLWSWDRPLRTADLAHVNEPTIAHPVRS